MTDAARQLAELKERIAANEKRITRLRMVLQHMASRGEDTSPMAQRIKRLEALVRQWRVDRQMLLARRGDA